jgi:hypothetical protein
MKTTVYDSTFTPEVEAVLKQQIKWLKTRCKDRTHTVEPYFDYGAHNECVAIKTAFEKQLKRLRHEARERAQKETT